MKVILSDDVGRRAEYPENGVFLRCGAFSRPNPTIYREEQKRPSERKKWRFGVVGRPFVECARPLLRAGSELINVIRLLQNALYLLCAPC